MPNEKKMPQTENSQDFDKKAESWYNSNKDEQGVVRINTKGLKPLNNPKCLHDAYRDLDDADNAWADVWKCHNCPVGWLTPKS